MKSQTLWTRTIWAMRFLAPTIGGQTFLIWPVAFVLRLVPKKYLHCWVAVMTETCRYRNFSHPLLPDSVLE